MSNFQNKYKVLQKIGEGSFSEVLKCQNRESGECFAAKRLKKSYKSNEGVLNCAEIIAAQKIPYHQNVLNLLEFHYENLTGKAIFIFELMDMSMYDLLKNRTRRIPEVRVKFFLYQILKGLTHLHNHGLFHRDVKPENILIKMSSSGELIKLADLGSVRGIYSEPPYTEYISTRWYRSPECLLTVGNYGPKMDVWATGCVFYEMLTLKPLFPGSNELDQLHKIHAILGTPNGKLLEKLKNKSRNCTCFPETSGTGLYGLLSTFSEHAKRLLKLMLEYDPDKRINARRLLQSVYFDSIRFGEERSEHLPYLSRLKIDQNSRNSGDSKKTPRSKLNIQERSNSINRPNQMKNESSKVRESSSSRKSTLNVSKTLIDIKSTGMRKNLRPKEDVEEIRSTKTWNSKQITVIDKTKLKKQFNEKFRKTTRTEMPRSKRRFTTDMTSNEDERYTSKRLRNLNSSRRVPKVDESQSFSQKRSLTWFREYTTPDDPDTLGPEGMEKFCEDIGVEPENIVMLVLAYKMQARQMGFFTKEEWLRGFGDLQCDSIQKLQYRLDHLRGLLNDQNTFKAIYRYAYDFARDKDQRSMDMETAKAMLQLLLGKHWPLYTHFSQFLDQSKYKVINKDQWCNILEFSRTIYNDLSNYDVDGAWPVMLDEFVEWLKASRAKTNTS